MKFLHDKHAPRGHNESMPEGQCVDCTIFAGPRFETKSLDNYGRCPSCADFFRRYGAAPAARKLHRDRGIPLAPGAQAAEQAMGGS